MSMVTAPTPTIQARKKPLRAPSLMIVMLIGPMGMETKNPAMKPVAHAMASWMKFSKGYKLYGS